MLFVRGLAISFAGGYTRYNCDFVVIDSITNNKKCAKLQNKFQRIVFHFECNLVDIILGGDAVLRQGRVSLSRSCNCHLMSGG